MQKLWNISVFFLAVTFLPYAHSAESLKDALDQGKPVLDIRYRLESVDQDGVQKDALASTLRTRLGYQTAPLRGWTALVEFENITPIGDVRYNDTINGETRYPVVADPKGTEVNRAQLSFTHGPHDVVLGRQRITLENHRFVGNVGWRQNEQTYDGALYRYRGFKKTTLSAYYLANANRIFGEYHPTAGDIRLQSFLAHADFQVLESSELAVFAYFFDNETTPAASHSDLGMRFHGKLHLNDAVSLSHDLSYAKQNSYRDGADIIDADYYSIGLGPQWGAFTITANLEVLGGDGTYGFSTPFATLHAFNGWADQFLSTPPTGLADQFLNADYKAHGWHAVAQYHRFEPDESGPDYGKESGLLLTRKIQSHWLVGGKFADYQADNFGRDIRKIWFYSQLTW